MKLELEEQGVIIERSENFVTRKVVRLEERRKHAMRTAKWPETSFYDEPTYWTHYRDTRLCAEKVVKAR